MNRIEMTSELSDLIVDVVSPGNAVFDNGLIEQEQGNFSLIQSKLDFKLNELLKDANNNREVYLDIESTLTDVVASLKEGESNTHSLFRELGRKNINNASQFMSKMDFHYFKALKSVTQIGNALRKKQRSSLTQNHIRAIELFKNEYRIVVLIVLAIFLMIFYGRKLKIEMAESESIIQQRNNELEVFSRGLNSHSIVAKTDRAGTIIYVNDKFTEVTGYSREELLYQNHRILNSGYHPRDFFVDLWTTISSGKRWHGKIKNKKKDGSFYWVEGTITPMLNRSGQIDGFLSIRTEITELMELQNFSENVQSVAKLGGWEVNLTKNSITWSRETYNIHELEYGVDLTVDKLFSYYVDQYRQMVKNYIENCIASGEGFSDDFQIKTAKGNIKWVRSIGNALKNNKGIVIKIFGTFQDITESKMQEIELVRLKDDALTEQERAKKAESAKSVFLANMSHEIRTPLNGVMGMVEILKETTLKNNQKEMLEVINNCGNDLLIILNDILDYSKIESGKLEVEKKRFSINECLKEVVSLFSGSASLRNNYIVVDIPKDMDPVAIGDKSRVKQVLSNYMSNAIKFTKDSFVEVGYKVEIKQQNKVEISFFVKDNGIGVPEQVKNQLFQAFVQGDQSITKEFGGSGLGLSISKKLADLMDCRVSFASNQGEGSIFYFHLCVDSNAYFEKNNLLDPVQEDVEYDFMGKVLVVEDNVVNQRIVSRYITSLGPEVEIVSDGKEAIEILRKKGVDYYSLILMDLQMPVMDGLTATKKIKKEFGSKHAPIIALTANAFKEDRDACLEAGMIGYIAKPVRKSDLKMIFHENLEAIRKAV